ncbi:MAG: hypothetical protein HYV68_02220 [Candidatus Taylorbacteria bacterium]|nr:hypothetical protein [Candidatus Taylorbacteria bacterium]
MLLRRYDASIEEQIAGLIHDVSHSAFSHAIDYVLKVGSPKEHSHQDNIFKAFVKKTEIPHIIKRYGFDPGYILEDKNFPLKERRLPDLCADRIDYSLREAIIFKCIKNADYFLENLRPVQDQWVFSGEESASKFSKLFSKLNEIYWAGLETAVMFKAISDFLKYSLTQGYIKQSDLYTTDKVVLGKIKKYVSKDKKIKSYFARMNNKVPYLNDSNGGEEVFCKSRVVDPLFFDGAKIKRLSDKNPKWQQTLVQEMQPKRYFVKFLDVL